MTESEARALGYEVVAASKFEVGLVKNGRGIRTWWNNEFDSFLDGKLPGLDHPLIQRAINIDQQYSHDPTDD
jgi:hypothetical protein